MLVHPLFHDMHQVSVAVLVESTISWQSVWQAGVGVGKEVPRGRRPEHPLRYAESLIPGVAKEAQTAPACSERACRKAREPLWGDEGDDTCGHLGCKGKRVMLPVLWALLPALHSWLGDRQGRCKVGCLGSKSCFACMCTSESLGRLLAEPPKRRTRYLQAVISRYNSIIAELVKEKPNMGVVRSAISELKLRYGVYGAAYPG